MTQTEALKLALDYIIATNKSSQFWLVPESNLNKTVTALKEALAQPEQEPVGEMRESAILEETIVPVMEVELPVGTKLYTTPPQRKPLTDEMVVAAARVLNERQADACGVDRDDQWAIYSDDFKADALAMLKAAHGIKE